MALASVVRGSLVCGALLIAAVPARATYSIIAIDVETGQVGGVGTSCVGDFSVYAIYGVAPGVGVVAAQASLNEQGRDRAVMLLEQGSSAADIIADITGAAFDPFSAVRQYAVIKLEGASAVGFTGASTMSFADDLQGEIAPYVYSVQGNILTSAAVLEQARAVFSAPGCDLADTLMLALEAGAENGEGDSRCTPEGIPSDGAFIEVNLADQGTGGPFVSLQVVNTAPANPLTELRAMYDAWRVTHPCPEPQGEVDAGMMLDAGMNDGGIGNPLPPQGGTMAPPSGGTGGFGGASGTGGVGGMSTGGIGATGGSVQPPVGPPMQMPQSDDDDSSGCTITRIARSSHWPSAFAIVLASACLRRRRALRGR